MAKLPSLPESAHITDLFQAFPQSRDTLVAFIEVVMRRDGDIPPRDRELIAAYVSGLNRCTFCYGSHLVYAEAFGIPRGTLEALLDDLETAPVDAKLQALLGYVQKLHALPSKIVQADIDFVLESGWSENALFEAVQIAGLFHMMNRIMEGSGVSFDYLNDRNRNFAAKLGENIMSHSYL